MPKDILYGSIEQQFMALPSFRYEDIGPLKNVECESVPNLMVIAGPNGVGKSTLFDNIARESQDHFATSRLYKEGDLESFLNEIDMPAEEIEQIKEEFDNSTPTQDDTNVAYVGPHRGMSKEVPIRERDLIGMPAYSTKFLHALSRLPQGATRYWLNRGQGNIRSGMFGNEKGMLDELPYYEVRRRLAQIHSNIEEHVTEEFFDKGGEVEKPDILEWLSPLQEAIEQVLPGIKLNGVEKTDDHEYVLTFKNRDDSVVNFDDLSSGEKDAVALLFLLVEDRIEEQFKDSDIVSKSEDDLVVLYDSPEAYLHPQLQLNFLNYIKDYLNNESGTDRNVQIIICTHSKMIVDNTPDESLYFLFYPDHVEDNQLRPASEVPDELRKLISNEMGLTALSSGEDILLVEGSDDREVIHRIDDEIEKEVSVIGMGGKDPIVKLDETFNKMMQLDGVNVYAIVDGDRDLNLDEDTPDNIHSLPVTSIENLILKTDVIFETLKEILGRKLEQKGYSSSQDVDDKLSSIITDEDFIEEEAHTRWNEQFNDFYLSYEGFEQSEGFIDIESFAQNELENRLDDVKDFAEIKNEVKNLAESGNIDQLQGKEILKRLSEEFKIKTERLLRMCAKKLDKEDLPDETESFLKKAKS